MQKVTGKNNLSKIKGNVTCLLIKYEKRRKTLVFLLHLISSAKEVKVHLKYQMCVCSVVSDFLGPHGPTRLLWPWNFPSKNTSCRIMKPTQTILRRHFCDWGVLEGISTSVTMDVYPIQVYNNQCLKRVWTGAFIKQQKHVLTSLFNKNYTLFVTDMMISA